MPIKLSRRTFIHHETSLLCNTSFWDSQFCIHYYKESPDESSTSPSLCHSLPLVYQQRRFPYSPSPCFHTLWFLSIRWILHIEMFTALNVTIFSELYMVSIIICAIFQSIVDQIDNFRSSRISNNPKLKEYWPIPNKAWKKKYRKNIRILWWH